MCVYIYLERDEERNTRILPLKTVGEDSTKSFFYKKRNKSTHSQPSTRKTFLNLFFPLIAPWRRRPRFGKLPTPDALLTLASPLNASFAHGAPYLLADFIQSLFRVDVAEFLERRAARAGKTAVGAATATGPTWRTAGKEPNAAEVGERFVGGEMALSRGAAADGGIYCASRWRCASVVAARKFGRYWLLKGDIAKGIGNDTGGVKVREHFWT